MLDVIKILIIARSKNKKKSWAFKHILYILTLSKRVGNIWVQKIYTELRGKTVLLFFMLIFFLGGNGFGLNEAIKVKHQAISFKPPRRHEPADGYLWGKYESFAYHLR